MISKELLSEVLGEKVLWVQDYIELGEVIFDSKKTNQNINIYELAHKCKEWAFIQGYRVTSGARNSIGYIAIIRISGLDQREFKATTEPEAIFKACEWILKVAK